MTKGTEVTEESWNDAVLPDPDRDNRVFFEDLTSATEYEIYTRTAETETSYAGDAVKANVYTTLSGIESDDDSTPTSPQTGDNSHLGLWIALMAMSLTGIASAILYGRKKRVFDK